MGNVPVPPGWFRSARASKSRRNEPQHADEAASSTDSWNSEPSSYSITQFSLDDGSDSYSWTGQARGAYHTQHDAALAYARDFGSYPSAQPGNSHLPPTPPFTDAEQYRGESPFGQSSSSSDYNSPTPPPPAPHPSRRRTRNDVELVPLAYLEGLQRPTRDPLDEAVLRRISAHGMSTASARYPQF